MHLALRIHSYVLWYYTPMALAFTDHLRPLATIYDCMDELSAFTAAPPALAQHEANLFARADLVFTGGQSLYDAKRHQHPQVYLFPSSVDQAHFARAREPRADPADQAPLPHPRLGFYGVLDERLDRDLVAAIADARPDWSLVLIGPVVKIDPASLPRRANIHYLGPKDYADRPAYLAGWDVALIPFAHNAVTRFISPTKTPEYLAAGVPVVSTAIRDVVSPYGEHGLVQIADTAADVVAAVERALVEDRARLTARVDAFLDNMSWDRTWRRMGRLIDALVDARRTDSAVAAPAALAASGTSDGCITSGAPALPLPPLDRPAGARADGAGHKTPTDFDYLIVGAGFAGSVLPERLATVAGKRVLIVDKRPHIGGNAYDHYDDSGVLVHKYGPHIFHTNSAEVFDYLSRFTQWRPYQHRVRALVNGQLVSMPINLDTINALYGLSLTFFQLDDFLASLAEPVERIRTSEDVVVSKVGRELYEKFFRGYTRATEFKYLTGQEHAKTTLVYEYPRAEGDPYYPVPRPENADLYKRYKALANETAGVYFVGRLATYKYYNMDQVVAQALVTFARIRGLKRPHQHQTGNGRVAQAVAR